jgi:hypothetical protein
VSARVEPRNTGMISQFVPQSPLRDPKKHQRAQRILQGAVPDLVHTDPSDGKEKMVEVNFLNQCTSSLLRYY